MSCASREINFSPCALISWLGNLILVITYKDQPLSDDEKFERRDVH